MDNTTSTSKDKLHEEVDNHNDETLVFKAESSTLLKDQKVYFPLAETDVNLSGIDLLQDSGYSTEICDLSREEQDAHREVANARVRAQVFLNKAKSQNTAILESPEYRVDPRDLKMLEKIKENVSTLGNYGQLQNCGNIDCRTNSNVGMHSSDIADKKINTNSSSNKNHNNYTDEDHSINDTKEQTVPLLQNYTQSQIPDMSKYNEEYYQIISNGEISHCQDACSTETSTLELLAKEANCDHSNCVIDQNVFKVYSHTISTNDDHIGTRPEITPGDVCESVDDSAFSSLPYEIIQKIMSYLSHSDLCHSAALVCRKWRDYSYDPIHWQLLNIHNASICDLSVLLDRTPLLRAISFHGQFMYMSDILCISQKCPLLRELDLGFLSTDTSYDCDVIMDVIATCCPNLEVLNLEACVELANEKYMKIICQDGHLPKLKNLNVSHCTSVTDDCILLLAESKPLLEALNIDGISWIQDTSIQRLVELRGSTLKKLILDGAELSVDSTRAIAEHCTQLHTLSWSFAEELGDDSLTLIKEMESLKSLTIRKGVDFPPEAVEAMFKYGHLKHLRKLDLSECTFLSDGGVKAIVECCCENLTHLSLCWCWHVTETGLQHIVDTCRNLVHLDLLGIDKITGECLMQIPEKMIQLRYLNMTQCNRIKDELMVGLLKEKPNLRAINYYGEDFDLILYECWI